MTGPRRSKQYNILTRRRNSRFYERQNRDSLMQLPKTIYLTRIEGLHAVAVLKLVSSNMRETVIGSSVPGTFNRANGQPLKGVVPLLGIGTSQYQIA